MTILKSTIAHLGAILVAGLLVSACGPQQLDAMPPAAQATIDALAVEVEALRAEVAALQIGPVTDNDPDLIAQVAAGEVDLREPATADAATTSGAALQSPIATPVDGEQVTAAGSESESEPTDTPTPPPSPTPLPTFVPAPLDGDPPAGRYQPEGRIDEFWAGNADRQQSLGWAMEATLQPVDGVVQNFEHGLMLWLSDTGQILALWDDDGERHWRVFDDTFQEGEMEKDPAIRAPTGLRQPERGFGKVWRIHPELREELGWALEREAKTTARLQAFERGQVVELGLSTYAVGQTPEGETRWDME